MYSWRLMCRTANGNLYSRQLGLTLVRWTGAFQEVDGTWLRWATPDGDVLVTADEAAEQAQESALQERQRAEQAERRAAELEAMLARLQAERDQPSM
jgi:hypothetical protein